MSPDDAEPQDRALQTFACQHGHELGRTNGRAVWPSRARIERVVTMICDCGKHRTWHPPPAPPPERGT